jgi:hypothetical protein
MIPWAWGFVSALLRDRNPGFKLGGSAQTFVDLGLLAGSKPI